MSEFASQNTFSTFFLLENGPSNFYMGTWPTSWRHILADSPTVILALWPRPGQQGGNKEADCIFGASSLIWKLLALIFLFSSSIGWKWSPALISEIEAMCWGLQSHLASPGLLNPRLFSWEINFLKSLFFYSALWMQAKFNSFCN